MVKRQSSVLAGDSGDGGRQLRRGGGGGACFSAVGLPLETAIRNQWSPTELDSKLCDIPVFLVLVFIFGLVFNFAIARIHIRPRISNYRKNCQLFTYQICVVLPVKISLSNFPTLGLC